MVTILFAVLAIIAILWVILPVMSEAEPIAEETSSTPSHDPSRPVLDQIADLDLEYAAGKIPETAYKHVRADLAVQAAAALAARDDASAARDEARSASGSPAAATENESSASRSRAAKSTTSKASAGDGGKRAKASAFCPGCGKPAGPQDKFCAGCGRNLKS